MLHSWLETRVVPAFAARILPVDAAVARRSAGLDGPDPQPLRAGLIAATALEHGLTVVTGNTADFNQRRDHATFGTDPVGCWGKGADHQSDTNSCSLPTPFGAQRFVWLRLIQAPVTTG